jgi:hypothetical protein
MLKENRMVSMLISSIGQTVDVDAPVDKLKSFSFTRMKNGAFGYQGDKNLPVRIQFDGFKLQQIEGKKEQFDYFANSSKKKNNDGKEEVTNTKGKRMYGNNRSELVNRHKTEAEDRILIQADEEAEIPNISKYITRIDVYLNPTYNRDNIMKLKPYQDRINFYDNKKDFDYQTNNTIALDEWYNKGLQNEAKTVIISERQLKLYLDEIISSVSDHF